MHPRGFLLGYGSHRKRVRSVFVVDICAPHMAKPPLRHQSLPQGLLLDNADTYAVDPATSRRRLSGHTTSAADTGRSRGRWSRVPVSQGSCVHSQRYQYSPQVPKYHRSRTVNRFIPTPFDIFAIFLSF